MLKITVFSTALGTTLKLEGKLSGPWVRELESCWGSLRAVAGTRPLCVDLTAVGYVSSAAKELLDLMRHDGAVIVGCDNRPENEPAMRGPHSSVGRQQRRLLDLPRDQGTDQRFRIPIAAVTSLENQIPERASQGTAPLLNWALVFLALAIAAAVIGFVGASIGVAVVAKTLAWFMIALLIGWLISGMQRSVP
jgi:uncharacterized membrane protein YtjA (UPF0391 family)